MYSSRGGECLSQFLNRRSRLITIPIARSTSVGHHNCGSHALHIDRTTPRWLSLVARKSIIKVKRLCVGRFRQSVPRHTA